ncbi:MAG TPA: hypothetical protein VKY57_02045 [Chitinispirillaceae bacterium]|nr:hypothetical protein [Chitinispirillaceae bacterium]
MYTIFYKKILFALFFLIFVCFSHVSGFGKNKVQYNEFSWKYLSSPHFNIYHHQNQGILPEISFQYLKKVYRNLSNRFNFSHKQPIPLIIYGNTNYFAQTNIITEILPEGVGGFTEIFKNRIAVPFNGSYSEFKHVLHHELVHAFIFGIISEQSGNILFSNIQIPLWFNEGLAEYLSTGWDTEADMFLIDRIIHSNVPLPGPELNGYMAYKGGQSFLFFLETSRGETAFSRLLQELKSTRNIESVFEKVYKKSIQELGTEWIQQLKRLYWPETGIRINPEENAVQLTSHLKSKNNFNLQPRISPDGSKIAFFSDKKDFTKILISDRKGKIIQEISQNGYGGYFESFHPFRSGMCWSPDGNYLAFVTKADGSDQIRIVDVKQKKLHRKIILHLNNISNPDWSPDKNHIVFTGIDKGYNDIYIYNIVTDSLRRLTETPVFESNPRFSPDGNKIVFSVQDTIQSDKSGINAYGSNSSDLAIIDLNSGEFELITNTVWNEKQPGYSSDGKHIIFTSDRNGIDNIYIAPVDSIHHFSPLTNYIGGCSNPDWSFDKNTVVFSLFQNQGWDIWFIENPLDNLLGDTIAHTQWIKASLDTSISFFQKARKSPSDSSAVAEDSIVTVGSRKILSSDTSELISSTDSADSTLKFDINSHQTESISSGSENFNTTTSDMENESFSKNNFNADSSFITPNPLPYRLKFTPDLISVGVGISTYYSPAGQALIAFSDIMGDHRITFAGDIQGNFKDYVHLFSSYEYLRKRIDFLFGGYFSRDYSFESIYGDKLFHDTEMGVFLHAKYPFSLNSRISFELYSRHIKRISQDSSKQRIESTALLPSLKYSFDNILWGITGPLNGLRANAKLILSPPFDFVDLPFVSIDTDIRGYLHLFKKFVWANRIFLGASFPLSNNSPARRFLLGGNENWLFYQVNTDEYDKNVQNTFYSDFASPLRGWNYLDITGTRVALINSEFRFPFIKEFSIAWPLPFAIRYVNGAIFVDIGNAWDSEDCKPDFPLPQKIYGGFGFGMRANLGIFILRFDRGWPTDWVNFIGTPVNYFSLGADF